MTAWCALRTAPQKEFAVAEILKHRGVTAFAPTETKWRRTSRHKKQPVERPMLPRYIMVRFDDPWAIVRAMQGRGVCGLVCFGGEPARIPAESIDWLARRSGAAVPTSSTPVHRAFAPGDRVEIVSGPFKDWCVELKEIKGEAGIVLLKMFGDKEREVPVRLDQLEAA